LPIKLAIERLTPQVNRGAKAPMAGFLSQLRCRGQAISVLVPAVLCGLCLVSALGQTAANESFAKAMQQGSQAMTDGNLATAVEAYTLATHLQPGFAEAYFNLGLAQEQAGRLDEARQALEKSLALKPSLRGAHLFLGTIAYKQNHLEEAETNFVRETRLDPQSAKAFMWLGVCRLAEDKPETAIAPLDKAHQLDPNDVDTLYHRGRAYLLVANASYSAMFKLDPDSVRVHQVLAEADAQAYRTGDAIAQYEIAVKTAPRLAGLHESLGDQYWIFGAQDKAAVAYGTELEIDPADTVARFKLGCLDVMHGRAAEGVSLLRQALLQDPSLSDAHYYLGNGLSELDRNEEAVAEYELAIAANPSGDRAISSYYRLSQAYRKLRRMEEAHTALASYQRLKAQTQARLDTRSAQIVRKRSQLPVDEPEKMPQ
jgi:tetratricopeptide (TPR) repeat protein